MLSFNQQSAGASNAYAEAWSDAQSFWATNTSHEISNSSEQWVQPEQVVSEPVYTREWLEQSAANYFRNYGTPNFNPQPTPNQIPQGPVNQGATTYYTVARPQSYNTPIRSHQARITLIPNSNGGFKTIVKRKRKRTMFTTEQIETLEAVFRRKPYVTREDRKILVEQLQIGDTSIKVWFQNRRLRGKRELEQAIEEAAEYYEENSPSEDSFYSQANSVQSSPEATAIANPFAYLDHIESELSQRADESGYIRLDEKTISDIVNAIDTVLSPDIDLELPKTANSEDFGDSYANTDTGSIYEPISPAVSEKVNEEEKEASRWEPFAPEASLQRLFDLHFC